MGRVNWRVVPLGLLLSFFGSPKEGSYFGQPHERRSVQAEGDTGLLECIVSNLPEEMRSWSVAFEIRGAGQAANPLWVELRRTAPVVSPELAARLWPEDNSAADEDARWAEEVRPEHIVFGYWRDGLVGSSRALTVGSPPLPLLVDKEYALATSFLVERIPWDAPREELRRLDEKVRGLGFNLARLALSTSDRAGLGEPTEGYWIFDGGFVTDNPACIADPSVRINWFGHVPLRVRSPAWDPVGTCPVIENGPGQTPEEIMDAILGEFQSRLSTSIERGDWRYLVMHSDLGGEDVLTALQDIRGQLCLPLERAGVPSALADPPPTG
ncbi:hypothetical protein IIA16_07015 [bacterium]|nr:hypothetical protein [bacterium]